ncbi:MAG: hypothetical protein K1X79_00345 [Oligoflexia bacterium]|nr:hypothetical protein [Oligoflexia bacterium]
MIVGKILRLSLLALFVGCAAAEADTFQVADLNSAPAGQPSSTNGIVASIDSGEFLLAAMYTPQTGTELLRLDTITKSYQIFDLWPGSQSSQPALFKRTDDDKIYFSAASALEGLELWVADSSSSAPHMVKDLAPGTNSSYPGNFTAFGNNLLFTARTSSGNFELWTSDGSTNGTFALTNFNSIIGPTGLTAISTATGQKVLFSANDTPHGTELYITDGSVGGTSLLADIQTGASSSAPYGFTQLYDNGPVVFAATIAGAGTELMKLDNGTVTLLADINPGSASSGPGRFVKAGNLVYFLATQAATGRELWVTDGSPAGTQIVKDLAAGVASSSIGALAPFLPTGSATTELFFQLNDPILGSELWRSDGTMGGTTLVVDLNPGSNSGVEFNSALKSLPGKLFFRGRISNQEGYELWMSDGSAGGTTLVKDILPGSLGSLPTFFDSGSTQIFFVATGPNGRELYASDGTSNGTTLLNDFNPSNQDGVAAFADTYSFRPLAVNSDLYTEGKTDSAGVQLIKASSSGSIVPLTALPSGANFGQFRDLTQLSNKDIYFTVFNSLGGSGTYRLDLNTLTLGALNAATSSGYIEVEEALSLGSKSILSADVSSSIGVEPYIFDGSTGSFSLLADLNTGSATSTPSWFTKLGDRVIFLTGAASRELHAYDLNTGTQSLIATLGSGSSNVYSPSPALLNGKVYFFGPGKKLYVTDGTTVGTAIVTTLATPALVGGLISNGTQLFFKARTSLSGSEVWTSDGTAAGTFQLTDLCPGACDSLIEYDYDGFAYNGNSDRRPQFFWRTGSKTLFIANDGVHGPELYVIDQNLTVSLLKDLYPGPVGALDYSNIGGDPRLAEINGLVAFSADDGLHGSELWVTDGEVIQLVADIVPGLTSSFPGALTATNSAQSVEGLFFNASTPVAGREIWFSSDIFRSCAVGSGKILPGVCGCQAQDLDLDNNGSIDCPQNNPAPTPTPVLSLKGPSIKLLSIKGKKRKVQIVASYKRGFIAGDKIRFQLKGASGQILSMRTVSIRKKRTSSAIVLNLKVKQRYSISFSVTRPDKILQSKTVKSKT